MDEHEQFATELYRQAMDAARREWKNEPPHKRGDFTKHLERHMVRMLARQERALAAQNERLKRVNAELARRAQAA